MWLAADIRNDRSRIICKMCSGHSNMYDMIRVAEAKYCQFQQ